MSDSTVERESAAVAADRGPAPEGRAGRGSALARIPNSAALVVFLVLEIAFFSANSPYFLNWANATNILTAISITGVLAAGATLLLVSGQFDLSVGSGVGFVGLLLVELQPGLGTTRAVLAAVAGGVAIGLLNGFLVNVLGINALITTLGTLAIFRGLTLAIGEGQNIAVGGFGWALARPFLDIPAPALVFLAVAAVFALVMGFTVYGREMYAIGANSAAARLVGIRVKRNLFLAFVISGLCMALAGLLNTSLIGSSSGTTGTGLELAAVTAVILGGTSLQGGTGGVFGTIIGLLIVGVLSNGLTLMNVDSSWQQVATGSLLILAVAFDRFRAKLLSARR
ncbi:ABC transporter permease [Actinomadura luteofluorescens]|uniref:ABC transporter permease n=1 Tax=Actinomadura luteofluorescens TaxID=46163 RepID=UPI0034861CD7